MSASVKNFIACLCLLASGLKTRKMESGECFNLVIDHVSQERRSSSATNDTASDSGVTSFENIAQFLATNQYPTGLNVNQKRTLRKAAGNFCLIGIIKQQYNLPLS